MESTQELVKETLIDFIGVSFSDYALLITGSWGSGKIIEGYHRQLRKVTKNKTAYSTDESLKKIIYLATNEISKKWTMPIRGWRECISQLSIYFEGRLDMELAS